MPLMTDNCPDRRLDPPEYPDMCACGHVYDDHDEDDKCCVDGFEEYNEAAEYGDIKCDERRGT